jgi:hypothetical protein
MFKVIVCFGLLIAFVSIVSSDELLSTLKLIPAVPEAEISREGGDCGGFRIGNAKVCDKGLSCVNPDPLLMDAPGICINLTRICAKH